MSSFEKLRCAFGDALSAAGRKDFVLQRKIWFTASYKFRLGGREHPLEDSIESPHTQVCLRQTCIKTFG